MKKKQAVNNESTVIGAGTVLDGNLKTDASATRVDGTINGEIHAEGTVIVGAEGKIKGNVSAIDLLVAGVVNGDVTAQNKIEIVANGMLAGDIVTKGLVIDEKAIFQGKCVMKSEAENTETKETAPLAKEQEESEEN